MTVTRQDAKIFQLAVAVNPPMAIDVVWSELRSRPLNEVLLELY